MSETTTATTSGGFLGDPAEAFAAPAGGGCRGSPASATTGATAAPAAVAGPCCGTAEEAKDENSCCGTEAKTEAVATGTGCCG